MEVYKARTLMWIRAAMVIFIIGILGAIWAVGEARQSASQERISVFRVAEAQHEFCVDLNDLRGKVRGVLERGRLNARRNGTLTPEVDNFYKQSIADLANEPCGPQPGS